MCFHCSPGPASRIHSCNEPDRTRASGSPNCTSQVAGIRGISPIPPWRICAGICSQMGPVTAMESVTPKKGVSHCEQEEPLGITEQICKMPANLVSLQIPSAALSFEIGPSMPNEAIPHRCFWHIQRSCMWNTNLGNMKKRKLTKDNLGSLQSLWLPYPSRQDSKGSWPSQPQLNLWLYLSRACLNCANLANRLHQTCVIKPARSTPYMSLQQQEFARI